MFEEGGKEVVERATIKKRRCCSGAIKVDAEDYFREKVVEYGEKIK